MIGYISGNIHFSIYLSICEQWGLRAPLGAAELYREGPCCWQCLSPTSLMIRGHCPVFPDQQVMGPIVASSIFVPGIEEKKRRWQFSSRMSPMRTLLPAALASVPFGFVLVRVRVRVLCRGTFLFGAASWAIAAYTRENFLGESWLTSGKPNFEG